MSTRYRLQLRLRPDVGRSSDVPIRYAVQHDGTWVPDASAAALGIPWHAGWTSSPSGTSFGSHDHDIYRSAGSLHHGSGRTHASPQDRQYRLTSLVHSDKLPRPYTNQDGSAPRKPARKLKFPVNKGETQEDVRRQDNYLSDMTGTLNYEQSEAHQDFAEQVVDELRASGSTDVAINDELASPTYTPSSPNYTPSSPAYTPLSNLSSRKHRFPLR